MSQTQTSTAAHLEAARRRGRGLMSVEASGARSYEVLHGANAAREGAMLVLALWAVLAGTGWTGPTAALLCAAAAALALYSGVSNGLTVSAQLRHCERELRREREEIRTQPEWEREEMRAIYEAKGFSGEILERILDTLCSDDDRLLKVMLEEELGIFFEQWNHPVLIGLVTGGAALAGGLTVAGAALSGTVWAAPVAAAGVIAATAVIRNGGVHAGAAESFGRWSIATIAVAGMAYFLSQLLAA